MSIKNCSDSPDALLSLIEEIKLGYQEPPEKKKRGRKSDFTELSFLLLAVVAVVTKTFSDAALHRLLLGDEPLLRTLEFSRVPHRTRLGKRLKLLREAAEEQIAFLGKTIVADVAAGGNHSQVSATDGRMYQAIGPKWHKKHRIQGAIPTGLRNVDTESKWSKSGYRGWVQGYRLVLQTLVFPEPVPLFAVWRENQLNEAKIALAELAKGRLQVTDVMLGDTTFGKEDFAPEYQKAGGWVLTPHGLPAKESVMEE